jgi:hypothetical protein
MRRHAGDGGRCWHRRVGQAETTSQPWSVACADETNTKSRPANDFKESTAGGVECPLRQGGLPQNRASLWIPRETENTQRALFRKLIARNATLIDQLRPAMPGIDIEKVLLGLVAAHDQDSMTGESGPLDLAVSV